MKFGIGLILVFLAVPVSAGAAVTINEIAWMGTTASANDEWIELYNDGASQDVTGWRLSDGMGLNISLSGVVPPTAHVVLERTDDNSAPGAAFMIYSGALSNDGATLSLYNASDNLVDQVAGGESWELVGGDNTTKETAQYTSEGWVTAAPTPGSTNVGSVEEEEEEENENDDESHGVDEEADGVPTLHFERRVLQTEIVGTRQVYVNEAVTYRVEASGVATGIVNALAHTWNFGDTQSATGTEVMHSFAYPGEYLVYVRSSYRDYVATQAERVVVLPVNLSLALSREGEIQLHNNARYEIDISGYQVQGKGVFVFSEHSRMLPGATVTIPREKVARVYGTPVALLDTTGKEVARYQLQEVAKKPQPQPVGIATPAQIVPESKMPSVSDNHTVSNTAEIPLPAVVATAPTAKAQPSRWPYLGLIALIGLGLAAIFIGREEES